MLAVANLKPLPVFYIACMSVMEVFLRFQKIPTLISNMNSNNYLSIELRIMLFQLEIESENLCNMILRNIMLLTCVAAFDEVLFF